MKEREIGSREVADILEHFLEGTGGDWDWDDFISVMSFSDPHLEEIRVRCIGLPDEFPSQNPREYCNEHGREVIRGYLGRLRSSD